MISSTVSPYNIAQPDIDRDAYIFVTDQGITYSCAFGHAPLISPIIGTYDLEVRDFMFYPDRHGRGTDLRVKPTILKLLDRFFHSPNQVLVYMCDDSEGELWARSRQKLFSEWKRDRDEMLDGQNLKIVVEDQATLYGGALWRRDCPHVDIVRNELIGRAGEMMREKYGYL